MFIYDTVSSAVNGLRERGYVIDFNLSDNCLICEGAKFDAADFEIVEVHRFEGQTDPADEAVVFAIESNTGLKGILVNAYGPYAESMGSDIVKKLSVHLN
jgi:hypothetical protein